MNKCPSCKHPGAIVLFTSVQCPNESCEHFSQERADEWFKLEKPTTDPTAKEHRPARGIFHRHWAPAKAPDWFKLAKPITGPPAKEHDADD